MLDESKSVRKRPSSTVTSRVALPIADADLCAGSVSAALPVLDVDVAYIGLGSVTRAAPPCRSSSVRGVFHGSRYCRGRRRERHCVVVASSRIPPAKQALAPARCRSHAEEIGLLAVAATECTWR